MVTNRRTRWIVAMVGVLVALLVYGLIKVWAQSANQAYFDHSTCTTVAINWNDVPTYWTPVSGGTIQLFCPWKSYTWRSTTYLMNDGQDYYYWSEPSSFSDFPINEGLFHHWDECLFAGNVRYMYDGHIYDKAIEYPAGYDGYMQCDFVAIPAVMHYGPRLYEVYDPYPGPMQGKSSQSSSSKLPAGRSGNPYP